MRAEGSILACARPELIATQLLYGKSKGSKSRKGSFRLAFDRVEYKRNHLIFRLLHLCFNGRRDLL
jgi:hypothetical protein